MAEMKKIRYFVSPEYEAVVTGHRRTEWSREDSLNGWLHGNNICVSDAGRFLLFDGRVMCGVRAVGSINDGGSWAGKKENYRRQIKVDVSPPEADLPEHFSSALSGRGYFEVSEEEYGQGFAFFRERDEAKSGLEKCVG